MSVCIRSPSGFLPKPTQHRFSVSETVSQLSLSARQRVSPGEYFFICKKNLKINKNPSILGDNAASAAEGLCGFKDRKGRLGDKIRASDPFGLEFSLRTEVDARRVQLLAPPMSANGSRRPRAVAARAGLSWQSTGVPCRTLYTAGTANPATETLTIMFCCVRNIGRLNRCRKKKENPTRTSDRFGPVAVNDNELSSGVTAG